MIHDKTLFDEFCVVSGLPESECACPICLGFPEEESEDPWQQGHHKPGTMDYFHNYGDCGGTPITGCGFKPSPDITSGFHGGNPESEEANPDRDRKELLRRRVEDFIKAQGLLGATSDEVEQALDLTHQAASPRLTELLARGYAVRGERRLTRSGRYARALVHVSFTSEDLE